VAPMDPIVFPGGDRVTRPQRDVRTRYRCHPVETRRDDWASALATETAIARARSARAVVLVEGISDQIALETLARRRGRDLGSEDVTIVPMGGATNLVRFLEMFGPTGLDLSLAGMCDEREQRAFRRGLERAGFGSDLTRADMERLGFFVCVEDLEDELIRALGAVAVERVFEANGALGPFRTFQRQPAWRGRPEQEQMHGFMNNWKVRLAAALVDELHLERVPHPMDGLLSHV